MRDLEERLKAQEPLARFVRDLPEDELPLAWRAELNAKLMAVTPAKKRSWTWVWKPAVGLALAGAMAVLLVVPRSKPTGSPYLDGETERAILMAHEQAIAHHELGTISSETLGSDTGKESVDWTEVDLETL